MAGDNFRNNSWKNVSYFLCLSENRIPQHFDGESSIALSKSIIAGGYTIWYPPFGQNNRRIIVLVGSDVVYPIVSPPIAFPRSTLVMEIEESLVDEFGSLGRGPWVDPEVEFVEGDMTS